MNSKNDKIIKPTPKQELVLTNHSTKYVLYGGARGGGKTMSSILFLLYWINVPHFRALVVRKNYPDLQDFRDRAYEIYRNYGAVFKKDDSAFVFPSGAKVVLGHLAYEDSYERYQGHEYNKIIIEELTHIPSYLLFKKLIGSLRSNDENISEQVLCTANPGGAGHEWVKEFWHINEKDLWYKEFIDNGESKVYIPATVFDNPYLQKNSPNYISYLKNLPLDLRQKWLYGSWDDIPTDDKYYSYQIQKMEKDGRICRIPIDSTLPTYASLDLGIKDQMVLWIAQIKGKEIRLVDVYADRNKSLKVYVDYLKRFELDYNVIIDKVFLPKDANVRSMIDDNLMTRKEKIEAHGFKTEVVKNLPLSDGIDLVRDTLSYILIDEGLREGINALKNYCKEFDSIRNRFKDRPLHDWTSDYADSLRYMIIGLKDNEQGVFVDHFALKKNYIRAYYSKRKVKYGI